jgi:inner membrane protein
MPGDKLKNSVGLRLIIIGFLSLVLLIPAALIQGLISEREQRRDNAVFEVSDKWGGRQIIAGPILTVPYKNLIKDEKGNLHAVIEYAHFLPENLTINAELFPELRYRGIYEVVLYNSKLQIRGNFAPPSFNPFSIAPENILWKDAFLALGLSDLKGIRDAVTVKWNEDELTANAGVDSKDVLEIGISVKPNVTTAAESFVFAVGLDLNGSGEISFAPVGKETKVMVASKWGNPSFVGEFLPGNRQVQSNQFNAEWKVLHLNRNYPQQWLGSQHKIMESAFGVRLLLPIDEYQKTMRTAKYAIMFIALTFLTFFLTEVLNKKVIHPIQYILIGLALILFYTLLLSFSEHIKFNSAYLLSSLAIIALITAYTKSVLSNNLATAIIAGILIILYGFLYIILQLQDYALLLGSIGLFVILAIVMYVTRKIDWFTLGKLTVEPPK